MAGRLPGTTIELAPADYNSTKETFKNLFLCGGLVLSQVSSLTDLEPYIVQNWVKRKFVSPPKRKQYTMRQFCRIAIINMLRESMQIERIATLLSYINGRLDDESDDLIDDSDLYFYYIDCISKIDYPRSEEEVTKAVEEAVKDFKEPVAGAKKRLIKVLSVMTHAHFAAVLSRKADEILNTLD